MGEKPNRKRMAAVGSVCDAAAVPHTPADFLASARAHRDPTRRVASAPTARNKWPRLLDRARTRLADRHRVIEGACRHVVTDRSSIR